MECVVSEMRVDVCVRKIKNSKVPSLIDTVCMIFEVVDTTKKGDERRGNMLGRGVAFQNITDSYDKWLGKKISFTRALNDAKKDVPNLFTKQERTDLWSFFKDKFGGNKFKE